MIFRPLQTPRLDLVALEPGHAATLFAIYGDPEVMRWYPKDPCADVAACGEIVARMRQGQRWFLVERATGEGIGSAGFHAWDRDSATARLSYELVPRARGRGLATEAGAALLDFGWDAMALRRVRADVHAHNTPSIRVLERLGFEAEESYELPWQSESLPFRVFARDA